MSPHARVGIALLLVTVCMVRAYPRSLNQTSTGSGETGWNQQHYAHGEQNFHSNRNSRPEHSLTSVQNSARTQRRNFPAQAHIESPVPSVSRQHSSDNRQPLQQSQRHGHRSEPIKQLTLVSRQSMSNRHQNNQQNNRRAQYRSIQPGSEDAPHTNEDQNRIEKLHTIPNSSHQTPPVVSRAYLSPPNMGGRVPDTRRLSEELKMSPQPSMPLHGSRGHTTVPVHRNNGTLARKEFQQDTFEKPRISSKTASPSQSGPEEGIVFPDQKFVVPKIGKDGLDCAKGLTFCEKIEGYPNKHISGLIQKEANLYKSLFGTDVETDIANRISPDEELCKYSEHIAYPQAGQTKDENWAWIANTEDFKQGVRVEVCDDKGSDCQLITNWPMGYKTQCKQKHIYRRLLSVKNDGTPSTDEFLFPSCCVCSVTKNTKK